MPSRAPSGWPSGPSRFPLATGSSQRGKPYGSTAFSIRDTHCQESAGRPDLLPCPGESPGRPHHAPLESPPAHAHPQLVPEVEGRHAGQHDGTHPQQSHRECGSQGGQHRDLRAFRWRCVEQTLHAQDPHAQEGKARGQTALEPCRRHQLTEVIHMNRAMLLAVVACLGAPVFAHASMFTPTASSSFFAEGKCMSLYMLILVEGARSKPQIEYGEDE